LHEKKKVLALVMVEEQIWCGKRFSSTYNVLDPSMEQPTHIKYLHQKWAALNYQVAYVRFNTVKFKFYQST